MWGGAVWVRVGLLVGFRVCVVSSLIGLEFAGWRVWMSETAETTTFLSETVFTDGATPSPHHALYERYPNAAWQ